MGVPKVIAQSGGTLLPLLLTGRLLLSHPSSISFSNFGSCRKTSVRFFTSMAAPPVAKKVRHEMKCSATFARTTTTGFVTTLDQILRSSPISKRRMITPVKPCRVSSTQRIVVHFFY
ncbi:hypothetical protein HPP92_021728 [Vanilla planifolia]|uniref:Uncharacterized protein n=1 Tax=Vanilla planifolia TaxID=51239 RepID=A0A835PQY1_VANPL|nr:hypothetical protein HPP92_021728 [Vanilla planifolia]